MEFLLLVPSLALAFLLWQEKRDRAVERAEHNLKEVGLLNRIQAPQIAAYQASEEEYSDVPLHVTDEDWEDFEEARKLGEAV
jgi:hypothetical protein